MEFWSEIKSTRHTMPHYYITYPDRLQILSLPSLQERRVILAAICILNIYRGELFSSSALFIIQNCIVTNLASPRWPNFVTNLRNFCSPRSPMYLALNYPNSILNSHSEILSITELKNRFAKKKKILKKKEWETNSK